jgi:hypothetical protein
VWDAETILSSYICLVINLENAVHDFIILQGRVFGHVLEAEMQLLSVLIWMAINDIGYTALYSAWPDSDTILNNVVIIRPAS